MALLGTLWLGACGGGYAPPEEQLALFQSATSRVEESRTRDFEVDRDALLELRRSALEDAERVDPNALQKLHVAMPRHFHGELVRGLRLWVQGAKRDEANLLREGDLAIRRWVAWHREARREIPAG